MYQTVKAISIATGTRTQDLIFTLYGDYIAQGGDSAWIGSLIALLGTLGTSEQAVRSTAARMARKGWLQSERQGRNSYYSLTPKAEDMLSQGARQIFSPPEVGWDGCWYMVTYSFTDELKHARHQLRKRLSWLGFGQLASGTWLTTRNRQREVRQIVDELDVRPYVDFFRAEHIHFDPDTSLAERCWNLDELHQQYHAYFEKYHAQYGRDSLALWNRGSLSLEHAFKQRFWLMHEYRYFPFHDPYLPDTLLPPDWLGYSAADLFASYHRLLEDKANTYVTQVMAAAP